MMKRPFESYILLFLLFLLALNAIYGGGSMIISPDGSLIGLSIEWLENSIFQNYLLPGFTLFTFMGVLPIISFIGLIRQNSKSKFNKLNIYPDKAWGWTYSLYSGIVCIIWIVIQQFMTQYFILQPIIICVGLLIVILCLMPGVQKYYSLKYNVV